LCALIYYPFVRILDKKNAEQELAQETQEKAAEQSMDRVIS
jgi:cellobiose PTS system EIIC component